MSQALFLWVLKTWFDTLLSANALGRRKPVEDPPRAPSYEIPKGAEGRRLRDMHSLDEAFKHRVEYGKRANTDRSC